MNDRSIVAVLKFGVFAGLAAGALMAMYAMAASAWMGQGFFTPLYGIASPLIGPKEMETSMMRGIHLSLGPALAGAMIHMMWSAMYGAIFGLIWSRIGGAAPLAAAAGVLYGLAVMAFMALVALPLVGAGSMPAMIGFSFVVEHALFGLALGLWPSAQPALFGRTRSVWQTQA